MLEFPDADDEEEDEDEVEATATGEDDTFHIEMQSSRPPVARRESLAQIALEPAAFLPIERTSSSSSPDAAAADPMEGEYAATARMAALCAPRTSNLLCK